MDIRQLLEKTAENVSVRRSFGTAYEKEGLLIIPVALVLGGGGGGEGPVNPPPQKHIPELESPPTVQGAAKDGRPPTGTGVGFGGLILPLGVYVVKDHQVRWAPSYDATLIVVVALSAVRALIGLFRHRRLRNGA
jgi:uncharacterized spore protein YtfJ